MYNSIWKICFFLFIVASFLGCSLGHIGSTTQATSTESEAISNGPLLLKENEISLFAGESYQFKVSGGRRPYSFAGALQNLVNPASYILTSTPELEPGNYSIEISDTSSQSVQAKLRIKGFKDRSAQVESSFAVPVSSYIKSFKSFSSTEHYALVSYSRTLGVAGTISRGKLLRSLDSGISFQSILETEDNNIFTDIFKTTSGKYLLFSTTKSGKTTQYVSIDSGNSFQQSVTIDNLNSSVIFVGAVSQNIYLTGFGVDSFGDKNIRIFISSNEGSSWTELKSISLGQAADILNATITGVVETSGNGLVVALDHEYYYANSPEASSWMIFQSSDNGMSWTRKDKFVFTASYGSNLSGFYKLSSTDLVAIGIGWNASFTGYIITRKSTDAGATWNTTNIYYNTINKTCSTVNTTQAPNGKLYVYSECMNGSNQTVAELRSSLDGSSWVLENSVTTPAVSGVAGVMTMPTNTERYVFSSYGIKLYKDQGLGQFASISSDTINLYSLTPVSASQNSNNQFQIGVNLYAGKPPWSIFVSNDGQTWSETGQFTYPSSPASLRKSSWLSDGSILAVGTVSDPSVSGHWITRRGVPSGNVYNWNTIDTYKATATSYAQATEILQTKTGTVLVAGEDRSNYLLRRTTDFTSWNPVDSQVNAVPGFGLNVDKLFQDSANVIYAFISEWASTGSTLHVRKSTDDGLTWQKLTLPFKGKSYKYTLGNNDVIYMTDFNLGQLTIRSSSDGAVSWKDIGTIPLNSSIYGPIFFDGNDLFMTGAYKVSGIVYTTIRISLTDLKVSGIEKQKYQNNNGVSYFPEYGVSLFPCDNNTFCELKQEYGSRLGERVGKIKRMIK